MKTNRSHFLHTDFPPKVFAKEVDNFQTVLKIQGSKPMGTLL